MHDIIGMTVTDKITGFKGTVIGRVEYITGCNQLLVQPPMSEGSMKDSIWLDEQRTVTQKAAKVVLENGNNPGFDRAPPRI